MKNFEEKIWEPGEYNYPAAYGFEPNIRTYLHDDDTIRPCMLVIPGGGYCMVCNVEGEPVVDEFYKRGMNCFVLTYTTDITMSVPLKSQPMEDASRAIRYIRKNADRFLIDPNRLSIIGFSAGGHLAASISVHFDDVQDKNPKYSAFSNRPDSTVLGYPVITSGEYAHRDSIISLLGRDASKEELDYFSLEKNVTENTPPAFIWQTVADDLVPVENSALYANALCEKKVKYAYYAFPHGRHGLSTLGKRVLNYDYGAPYTFEQLDKALDAVKSNQGVNVSKERRDELMLQFFGNLEGKKKENETPENPPVPYYDDVALWPALCEIWLKSIDML